jgi:hypothetical protein
MSQKLTRKEKFAQQREEAIKTRKEASSPEHNKKHRLILGLILAAVGFLLYANTFNHEFVLDDSNAVRSKAFLNC